MDREQIILRIPKELNEWLKAKAKEKGLTRHAFIVGLLNDVKTDLQ